MQKEELEKVINRVQELPTLPSVALQINRMLMKDNTAIESVTEILERDPALASKVLRLANSSYYGLSCHVDTLSRAVIVLGFNAVRNLVVTVSLLKIFKNPSLSPFDIKGLWLHSMGCAIASKALSCKNRHPVLQEKTFLCGILHDIGKLLIYTNLPVKMTGVIEKLQENKSLTLHDAEKEILDFTHSDVGALLAEKWHFPRELTDAIKLHHNPQIAKDNHEIIYAVHAGNEIAKALELGRSAFEKVRDIHPDTWKILSLSEEDLSMLLPEIKSDFDSVTGSLDLD